MGRPRKRKPSNAKQPEASNENEGQNEEIFTEAKDAPKVKSAQIKTEGAQKGKRAKAANNTNEAQKEEDVPTPALFIESFCSLDKEGRIEALKKLIASFDADEIDKALEIMDAKLADKVDEDEIDSPVKSEDVNVKEESLVYVTPVMETDEADGDTQMDFEIKQENVA